MLVLQDSKPMEKVVLSSDVFELGDLFLLTRRMMEADFQVDGVFDGRVLSPRALVKGYFDPDNPMV